MAGPMRGTRPGCSPGGRNRLRGESASYRHATSQQVSGTLPHVLCGRLLPVPGASGTSTRPGGVATLDDVAFCLHCRNWVTVTAASLCTCGAFVVVGPAPPAFVPLHELKLTAVDASDSESPHPAEPDPTFDGPAALYSTTASTTQLIRHVVRNSGAASTTYIVGPLAPS